MRINEINRTGSVQAYRNQNQDKMQSQKNKDKASDEVHISAEAKRMLEAQQMDSARGMKLAELKQAVSTGTYHVDADKVAEKLLPYLE